MVGRGENSELPMLHNGGDGSFYPPPTRNENNVRNVKTCATVKQNYQPSHSRRETNSWDPKKARNGGVEQNSQVLEIIRNGGATILNRDLNSTRNCGPGTEIKS